MIVRIVDISESESFEISVPAGTDMSLLELKEKIREKKGYPIWMQRIIKNGKEFINESAQLKADVFPPDEDNRDRILNNIGYDNKNTVSLNLVVVKFLPHQQKTTTPITDFANRSYYQLPLELRFEISQLTPQGLNMPSVPDNWDALPKEDRSERLNRLMKCSLTASPRDYWHFPFKQLPLEIQDAISLAIQQKSQGSIDSLVTLAPERWDGLSEADKKNLLHDLKWSLVEFWPGLSLLTPIKPSPAAVTTQQATLSEGFFKAKAVQQPSDRLNHPVESSNNTI